MNTIDKQITENQPTPLPTSTATDDQSQPTVLDERTTSPKANKFVSLFKKIGSFLMTNIIAVVAFALAVVTVFFVPIDAEYLNYFDWKTLSCLFCTLAIVGALKNIKFFYMLAQKIIGLFKTARASVIVLVYITFIGSMLIANDMALLTFLPLGYMLLSSTGKQKYMAFTFIMQNIAANLGGMLTPFGNPQNLYLYTKFNIPTLEFMSIMVIPFLVSIALITLCCFIFVKPEPLQGESMKTHLDKKKAVLYLLLFIFSIVIIFRVIPYWLGLIIIPLSLLIVDRKALLEVDYTLLCTFFFFFIFSGNVARIDFIKNILSNLMSLNPLLVSVLTCQCISNVPSAIILSNFTVDYKSLLLGVNIGGVGSMISSLASLITFREYKKRNPTKILYYIGVFSAFNFFFLIALTSLCLFL